MKCRVVIDPTCEEEVVIYTRAETETVSHIRRFVEEQSWDLVGYTDTEMVHLIPSQVYCFTVENNRVYAVTEHRTYRLKCRLYQLERQFGNVFIKINQSCLANVAHIQKFEASLGGTLTAVFPNGYTDYVSRRQLKSIKERLGISR